MLGRVARRAKHGSLKPGGPGDVGEVLHGCVHGELPPPWRLPPLLRALLFHTLAQFATWAQPWVEKTKRKQILRKHEILENPGPHQQITHSTCNRGQIQMTQDLYPNLGVVGMPHQQTPLSSDMKHQPATSAPSQNVTQHPPANNARSRNGNPSETPLLFIRRPFPVKTLCLDSRDLLATAMWFDILEYENRYGPYSRGCGSW